MEEGARFRESNGAEFGRIDGEDARVEREGGILPGIIQDHCGGGCI